MKVGATADFAAETQRAQKKPAQRTKISNRSGRLMKRGGTSPTILLTALFAAAVLAGCDDKKAPKNQQQDAQPASIESKVDEVRRQVESFGDQVADAIDQHTPPPDAGPGN